MSTAKKPRLISIVLVLLGGLLSCKQMTGAKVQESDTDVSFKKDNMIPLTPTRDQQAINFCWSYSTMAFLESLHKLRTGKDIAISPEALGFYHNVDYIKGAIAHATDADDVIALAEMIENDIDPGNYYDSIYKGSVSLLRTYGVVPEAAFPVTFSSNGKKVSFKARSPTDLRPAEELAPSDLLHRELADNLRTLMATKGLAYVKAMSEPDIINQIMLSRYGVNFTKAPPQSFTFEGKVYSPQTFITDYLMIDLNALTTGSVSDAVMINTASSHDNVDLPTLLALLSTNFKAGIGMPLSVREDQTRIYNGRFTTATSNMANFAATKAYAEKQVAAYEKSHQAAIARPAAGPALGTASANDSPSQYLYYLSKAFLAADPATNFLDMGGHAMFAVGPIKAPLVNGQDSQQIILKNSWGVSTLGTKDVQLTSDGLFILEEGYMRLVVAHPPYGNISYLGPKQPGVAPFLAKANYVAKAGNGSGSAAAQNGQGTASAQNGQGTASANNGQGTGGVGGQSVGSGNQWCNSAHVCYPYCTNGSADSSGFGWQPALNGPNGGSCHKPN